MDINEGRRLWKTLDGDDHNIEKNVFSWPPTFLDEWYGDKNSPCLSCLVQVTCKKTYDYICEKRFDYYDKKLNKN